MLLLTGHTLKDSDYTIDFHRRTLLEPEESAGLERELASLERSTQTLDPSPDAVLATLEEWMGK